MGGTAECHPKALALKGVCLENQAIVTKFLICAHGLTEVLKSLEREFQPERKVWRRSNFISVIPEFVSLTELSVFQHCCGLCNAS